MPIPNFPDRRCRWTPPPPPFLRGCIPPEKLKINPEVEDIDSRIAKLQKEVTQKLQDENSTGAAPPLTGPLGYPCALELQMLVMWPIKGNFVARGSSWN